VINWCKCNWLIPNWLDKILTNITRSQAVARIAERTASHRLPSVTFPCTFMENYLCARSAFPIQSRVSNLRSLAQVVLKIMFDHMPKIVGITWPRPRPLSGKLFERPLAFPQTKLCTKFEVCSSSSFGDMLDRMPKIVWSRDLGHAHFQGKIFVHPLGFPIQSCAVRTKFDVSSSNSFRDIVL